MLAIGNDSVFNSLNPFVSAKPSYYTTFMMGNAGDSLGKKASWFSSVFFRDNQSDSIVNAELLDANSNVYNFSAAVANPQSRLDFSPRLDFQLGEKNTLTVRYMLDRRVDTNSGVSQFALQSQAYNVTNYENTLQLVDTQVLSANAVNETRFQYVRDRDSQSAQAWIPPSRCKARSPAAAATWVWCATTRTAWSWRTTPPWPTARMRSIRRPLRLTPRAQSLHSGFNGHSFTPRSRPTLRARRIRPGDGGQATLRVALFGAGLSTAWSFELRQNFTPQLRRRYRYEAQNRIADRDDWAPRVSFAWAPKRGSKPASTVIRAGYGWFYDCFGSNFVLDAIRNNGVNQQQYVVMNPTFTQNAPPVSVLAAQSAVAPTIYQVDPHFHASLNMQAAVGVEHSFGKVATASVTYVNSRGVHQYLSDNINAFLPGTYDPATGTGARPNGINENIYQFQSEGIYNQNQVTVNYNVHASGSRCLASTCSISPRPIPPAPPTSRPTSSIPAPTTAAL